ncbi:butyrate kinase [Geobacter metallireducens RCH3]|uniref:Probable butyrate kinase n=1 Tax=Geobacter metallireducens (strain ATCC 53774 / DSM 7210 / GS-15) TaxID=269799 RepID=Q39TR7_GEOMG|nr:butyrate kinase [Geobacter metallireducens]ABB32357.1 butyrate kinase [Geobacter metallireducens GS-15]EHP86753.1 butyrate kinase [Geobacter metallireducens RCH3]
MDDKKILIINPGSTSTKIGVFTEGKMIVNQSVKHDDEELRKFPTIWDQYDFRRDAIFKVLADNNLSMGEIDAIACRGGNVRPLPGGIYRVCPKMIEDMKSGIYGGHPINVGGLVAFDLGNQFNIPVLTADPPMTDELCASARYSGIPQITRQSSFHALNQKATARKIAAELGKKYDEINLIVAHLGGGISVGAHRRGKIIDVNNALDGDGPFSPERAGSLPAGDLVKLCFSGEYTKKEVLKLLTGKGGLFAYMGTTDAVEIEKRIAHGGQKAAEVYEAMIYQVAKEIGASAAVLEGDVDAIALTGSLAYSKKLVESLSRKISFIAPVLLNPGENEMEALADAAMRYFNNEEALSVYHQDKAA